MHFMFCNLSCCRGKINSLLPDNDFGPNINFFGLNTEERPPNKLGWVVESPPNFDPVDLYTAMKLTRATRLVQSAAAARPLGVCAPKPAASQSLIPIRSRAFKQQY
jgi:hypothetical protein